MIRERMQDAELGLEVVWIEKPGFRLSLYDVAAHVGFAVAVHDRGVERESLLREALGLLAERIDAHFACVETLGEEPFESGLEVAVHAVERVMRARIGTAARSRVSPETRLRRAVESCRAMRSSVMKAPWRFVECGTAERRSRCTRPSAWRS